MAGFDDPAFYGDRWAAVYDDHHRQMDPVPAVEFLAGLAGDGRVLVPFSIVASLASCVPRQLVSTYRPGPATAWPRPPVLVELAVPAEVDQQYIIAGRGAEEPA